MQVQQHVYQQGYGRDSVAIRQSRDGYMQVYITIMEGK